jgi:hypothetical protein
LPHHFKELPLDVLGLQMAYRRAKDLHATLATPLGFAGYRIFVVFRDQVRALDLSASPDVFMVIGRHTHCDVVIDADPTIALRHLLVRAVVQPDGRVGVRFLDLQTSLAFHVDDGGPCRSIYAMGPVAIRLGPYAIVALPLDPHALPPSLPRPTLTRATSMSLALRAQQAAEGGPYRSPQRRDGEIFRSSHITILPIAPAFEDLPQAHRAGYGRITVDGGGRAASVEIPESEVDAGVIIGRALKCRHEGLRALLDLTISRAHILLLREEGLVYAFDLASTRGTYVYGARVRRSLLPDTGATLALAHPSGLRLHWHRRAA